MKVAFKKKLGPIQPYLECVNPFAPQIQSLLSIGLQLKGKKNKMEFFLWEGFFCMDLLLGSNSVTT